MPIQSEILSSSRRLQDIRRASLVATVDSCFLTQGREVRHIPLIEAVDFRRLREQGGHPGKLLFNVDVDRVVGRAGRTDLIVSPAASTDDLRLQVPYLLDVRSPFVANIGNPKDPMYRDLERLGFDLSIIPTGEVEARVEITQVPFTEMPHMQEFQEGLHLLTDRLTAQPSTPKDSNDFLHEAREIAVDPQANDTIKQMVCFADAYAKNGFPLVLAATDGAEGLPIEIRVPEREDIESSQESGDGYLEKPEYGWLLGLVGCAPYKNAPEVYYGLAAVPKSDSEGEDVVVVSISNEGKEFSLVDDHLKLDGRSLDSTKQILEIVLERDRIRSVPWVKNAAEIYTPSDVDSINTQTDFFRGDLVIEYIDSLLPTITHQPSIMIVGLGRMAKPILCCTEPHRVGAHLQEKGIDYQMTLVDIFTEVIDDIRDRRTLYLNPRVGDETTRRAIESNWRKYLADTGQSGRYIHEAEYGLEFNPYALSPKLGIDEQLYLRKGILAADVSLDFHARLADGRTRLVESDIAVANLSRSQPFDLVELRNVLYMLDTPAQQLALANIAAHMRKGGKILLEDIGGYTGIPVLPEFGGWLTEETLDNLHLEVSERFDTRDTSALLVLTKV